MKKKLATIFATAALTIGCVFGSAGCNSNDGSNVPGKKTVTPQTMSQEQWSEFFQNFTSSYTADSFSKEIVYNTNNEVIKTVEQVSQCEFDFENGISYFKMYKGALDIEQYETVSNEQGVRYVKGPDGWEKSNFHTSFGDLLGYSTHTNDPPLRALPGMSYEALSYDAQTKWYSYDDRWEGTVLFAYDNDVVCAKICKEATYENNTTDLDGTDLSGCKYYYEIECYIYNVGKTVTVIPNSVIDSAKQLS